MVILEAFTIITAFFLEALMMQTGSLKGFTTWLTKDRTAKFLRARLFFAFVVWVGSLLYLVYAVAWCFSESFYVQVSGLVLMVLTGISYFGFRLRDKEKPFWYTQTDSMVSMGCIIIVAIARIKGA